MKFVLYVLLLLFEYLLRNYQKDLEEPKRGSNFFLIVLIYCIIILLK